MAQEKTPKFVITIDGPGGSGKDTLADNLVKSDIFHPCSVTIFNSGNFSRAIALDAAIHGVWPDQSDFEAFAIHSMEMTDFSNLRTELLHDPDVEKLLPSVAAIPQIRAGFEQRLPDIIAESYNDVVLVLGRITGSLYPQANMKFHLDTSPEICADRRAHERSLRGENYHEVRREMIERNKRDVTSWNNNFAMPDDTIHINTDHANGEEVCRKVIASGVDKNFSLWLNA